VRIPSLPSFCLALCLSSSVYAELSPNDLPYLQGTPIADGSWEIQDYSHDDDRIQWIWLQQGAQSAYVIYPSDDDVVLPDHSLIAASIDQMTLRFVGDAEQELQFTRFGNAHITLVGDSVLVRYTAVAANDAAGAYPGDLSMDANEIHMEGELLLDGSMNLDAQETLGLYGFIAVEDELYVHAATGVVMGTVENQGVVLDTCAIHSGASAQIQIESLLNTKGCKGDVIIFPENSNQTDGSAPQEATTQANVSSSGKGGSTDAWLLVLAIFAGVIRFIKR
jgi:hypothetical protein